MLVPTGKKEIGTSGPIDADGNGPQRARQASDMGSGREGAICEYDEIMQILPGSSDDALLINASRAFGNIRATSNALKTGNTKIPAAATSRTARSPMQTR